MFEDICNETAICAAISHLNCCTTCAPTTDEKLNHYGSILQTVGKRVEVLAAQINRFNELAEDVEIIKHRLQITDGTF